MLLRAEFHEMLLFIFCEQLVDILVFAAVDIVAFNAVVVLYIILELIIAVIEVDRVQIVVELDFVRSAVFNGGIAQLFDIALEILALLALGTVLLIFVNASADECPAIQSEHHAVSDIHAYFTAEHGGRLGEKIRRIFFAAYAYKELYLVSAVCGEFAEERREIDNVDCGILRAENGSESFELAFFAVYRSYYFPLAAPEMREHGGFYEREQSRLSVFDEYFSHHQRERGRRKNLSSVRRNAELSVICYYCRMAVRLAREPVVDMIFIDGRVQYYSVLVHLLEQRIDAPVRARELLGRIVIGQELVLLELPAQVVENYALEIRRNPAAERVEQFLVESHGGFKYIIGRENG